MKKGTWLILVVFLVSAVFLPGCSSNNDAQSGTEATVAAATTAATEATAATEVTKAGEVIELKLHHHDPPTATVAKSLEAWAKRVEDRCDGKVKITIYPSATLGSAKDAYDMVKTGVCDIAWGFTGFFPGVFPVTEGLSLPMLGVENCMQGSMIMMDMFENTDYLTKEYSQVKVLYVQGLSAYPIATNKKEVKTIEDLKGLKLRAPGGPPTTFLKNVGAAPMNIPSPELYTSLERSVIDGYVFDWTGIAAFKLQEQTKYILDCGISTAASWNAMNLDKWNSLPDDVKAAFEAESGMEGVKEISTYWDNAKNELASTVFKDKISTLSPEEKARWQEQANKVAQDWIKEMDSKGYKGQEIYNKYVELAAKYKK